MPVPTSITDLSDTAASNFPQSSDSAGSTVYTLPQNISAIIKKQFISGSDITVLSSGTVTLPTENSYVKITSGGTFNITGFANCYNGRIITLRFAVSTLTLVHSASLLLPGGVSITAQADDVATFVNEASGIWRCISYDRAIISSINSGSFSFKNKIINGNFAINQRAYVSGAAVGSGLYGHDRWKMAASGDTYTFTGSTITIPASKTLAQTIEGANLQTGTYTLSWTGTAQGKIGGGSYGASGITGSITAGTDTTITFNTGTVSNVQLEFGSTATAFEYRPIGIELALCQRYCEAITTNGSGSGDLGIGYLRTTTSFIVSHKHAVEMRIAPAVFSFSGAASDYAVQAGGSTLTVSSIAPLSSGTNCSSIEFTTSAGTVGFGGRAYASAGARTLIFSAEF